MGCVLDRIRRENPQSRYYREKLKKVEAAVQSLSTILQHDPTEEEIAESLGLSVPEYRELLAKIQPTLILSLEEEREETRQLRERLEGKEESPEEALLEEEKRALFRELFLQLKPQEKEVLYLYYYEELTMKEIAKTLDISESRVSQIHTLSVIKLRKWVKEKRI